MFRSPLSRACCAGLSDNDLLLLASCRKDSGVLALLVARRASKRLAIEKALLIYMSFNEYTPRDTTIVTAWRTWHVVPSEFAPRSQCMALRLVNTYARACFIRENFIFWTFSITYDRLCILLKDAPGLEIFQGPQYALWVKTTEANAVDVARLILDKC